MKKQQTLSVIVPMPARRKVHDRREHQQIILMVSERMLSEYHEMNSSVDYEILIKCSDKRTLSAIRLSWRVSCLYELDSFKHSCSIRSMWQLCAPSVCLIHLRSRNWSKTS